MSNVLASINQARVQDMVGRTVQALLHNSRGEVTDFVEGVVRHIKISGNQSVLVVGNREVFPWEVATVADGPILLGSTYFTNGDVLVDVEIRGDRAFLVFQSTQMVEEEIDGVMVEREEQVTTRIHIERINYAMEALQFIDQFIEHSIVSGIVQDITIRNAVPFLNVRTELADGEYEMHEVSFMAYMADRLAARNAANNTNNNANNNTNNNTNAADDDDDTPQSDGDTP
jgi:phage gp46-like protein